MQGVSKVPAPKSRKKPKKGTLFGKPRDEVIRYPGSFTAQAEGAGMSTGAFASKVLGPGSNASARTKRRANLSRTFASMRKKRKRAA